jgi:hypothetical protein
VGYAVVAPGQTIASAHINLIMRQSILNFANSSERTSQIPSPSEGVISWLADVDKLEIYKTGKWRLLGTMRMGHGIFATKLLTTGVDTKLPYQSLGGYANAAGRGTWDMATGEYTVPFDGSYQITTRVTYLGNSTGQRKVWVSLYKGGSWTLDYMAGGAQETNTPGSSNLWMSTTGTVFALAGEKIAVWGHQNCGANLTFPAAHGVTGILCLGSD